MTDDSTLTAADVQYLAFEGGGGKGIAYLGACAALAHPAIGLFAYDEATDDYYLERRRRGADRGVDGVAGASAGAITAALLASGWGIRGLYRTLVVEGESVDGFFDPATSGRRRVPVALPQPVRAGRADGFAETSCLVEQSDSHGRTLGTESDEGWRGQLRYALDSSPAIGRVIDVLVGERNGTPASHPAVHQLLRNPGAHLRDLVVDYGLFSGGDARAFIDRTLSEGRFVEDAAVATGVTDASDERSGTDRADEPGRNLTFAEHRRLTGVDLVVTGTNLRSSRGEYLSARHGPAEMAVADAVRISMGIPLVFKPVRIDAGFGETGWARAYEGLWVDGGVLDNTPIHAFDTEDGAAQNVLGLRLGAVQPNDIEGFGDYLRALAITLVEAAKTRAIRSAADDARTVVLPIPPGTLSTLVFTPDNDAVYDAGVAAAAAVLDYFGVEDRPERVFEEVVGVAPSVRTT